MNIPSNCSAARCSLVAELSANHNHDIERAESLIRAAAAAGADAVKLQTYTPDTLTIPCDNEFFRIRGTIWEGKTLYELYQQAFTPWEWHPRLQQVAEACGLEFFSTPFDSSAVDFLEGLNVPRYKIASFELVDTPLLKKIGATKKPVILSTGMATLAEIDEAVRTLRMNGTTDLTLLKCTSAYPALPEEANLRTIPHLAQAFACKAGLSDHTMGGAVPVAAVALGACVVEKHFTLSRADGGPDGVFSMEPEEFRQMARDIRVVEAALGRVCYDPTPGQRKSSVFRRSLFVVRDMRAGDIFTRDNVRSIRPGYGLLPRFLEDILGRRCGRDIPKGTPVSWELLQ